jgi:subtilisin family serine protease
MRTNTFKITAIVSTFVIASFSCTQDLEKEHVPLGGATRGLQEMVTDTYFYAGEGGKVPLNIREDRVIIKTNSEAEAIELSKQKIFLSDRPAYDVAYVWVLASIDPAETNLEDLLKLPGVVDVTYGLEYEDGTLQYPTDKIYVKFKELSPEEALEKAGLTKNVVAVELYDADRKGYDVTLNVKLSDILRICRDLYESGLCEWAEPSFFREMKPHNAHYSDQWGLKNTGQYGGTTGIDINAEAAWAITQGSSNIKVAVIDEGVDLGHPDLQANLLPGYDATVNPPGGANGSPWANNAHGTACAGIVGAINNTVGVVGVASGCKIVPVRIAYDRYNNGDWTTNDDWVANGINYARQNADVLSNSWGGGTSSTKINNAINDAVTLGRGGKGCVVVFSAGNENLSTVSYPASLSDVIAVGAISFNGMRKSPSTPDGEYWGSNYGSALDVVAPGVLVPTTDIRGNAGYNPNVPIHPSLGGNMLSNDYSDQNYTIWFNGTSAACPHVSGVAALILSKNPALTRQQVSDIIEESAQKVNPATYNYATTSGRPNGTWNNQMGYGLVDAYAALQNTPVVPPPVTYSVEFSAYNSTNLWKSIHFEAYSAGKSTVYSNASVLSPGSSYSVTFSLEAGEYCLTAYSEMDGLYGDYECTVNGSGWISYTLTGDAYGTQWEISSGYSGHVLLLPMMTNRTPSIQRLLRVPAAQRAQVLSEIAEAF